MIDVRLVGVRFACEGVRILELAATNGHPLPRVEAGSHVTLHLADGAERPYFIASRTGSGAFALGVRRDPDGTVSKYLCDKARVGALMRVTIVAAPPIERDVPIALVAEDIGIFYAAAVARSLDARGCDWSLHYDAWSRDEAPLLAELRTFADRARIHVRSEHRGRGPDWAEIATGFESTTRVYGAGSQPCAAAVAKALVDDGRGIETHVRWTGTTTSARRGRKEFDVLLARSDLTIPVHEGESILDALEFAGIRAPHFCRGGICGRCKTRVLHGEPLHRDAYLSERERAANDMMMICRSRARGDRLVLDL